MKISLTLPGNLKFLSLPTLVAREICELIDIENKDKDISWAIEVAISEAVTNAIKYGCKDNGNGIIKIEFILWSDRIEINILDWGNGFELEEIGKPDFSTAKESGYGLYIMREVMDEMTYRREESHNILKLIKIFA